MSETLSSNTFRMAVLALERSGQDADPILDECEIPRKSIEDIWGRIPIAKEKAFWELAVKQTGDVQLGLTLGKLVPFGSFPLVEYAGASCPTVLHALHLLTRYSKIVYGGWNPELDERKDAIDFSLGASGDPEFSRHTTEFAFTLVWERLQEFAATEIPLNSVGFRHQAEGDLSSYQKIFGENVFFETSEDRFSFSEKIRQIPCKNSNPLALGSLIHGVDALLNKLSSTSSHGDPGLGQAIRAEIENQVSAGDVSAEQVSIRLGISKRTLQRKLEAEGRSFRGLVSEVRREIATKFLKESDESVEQIAFRVGYSDLKAFSRAFAEWYRMTPTAFRKAQKK